MHKRGKNYFNGKLDVNFFIPFSGFLILLLMVFVIIFNFSDINPQEIKIITKLFNNEVGVKQKTGKISEMEDSIIDVENNEVVLTEEKEQILENVIEDLKIYVLTNDLNKQIQVDKVKEGIIIYLNQNLWSSLTEENLNYEYKLIIKEVSGILIKNQKQHIKFKTIISGYPFVENILNEKIEVLITFD